MSAGDPAPTGDSGEAPPAAGAGTPPAPSPGVIAGAGERAPRRSRREAWLLAAGAASAIVAVWALARYGGPRTGLAQLPESPAGAPGAGAPVPSQEELVRQRYNMMLQVRATDGEGRPMPVGAVLPRRMEFVLTGANGQPYAQQFDRVGIWAVEVPAGTYTIATTQPGLGNWKWKLTGEALRPATGGGWTITFTAGAMQPMVDLALY